MKIKRGEGLNIVPFIDIMLVLLAIVLTISTFVAQGKIKVDVPEANSAQQPKQEKTVVITVDANNVVYLDDKPIDLEKIKEIIAPIDNKTLIELKSDKQSKFEVFVKILDALKEKNHENFAISTRKN
ncbi:TonB system transport protein ExbD [Helicobacter mustelae]|uniref:Biopolymer transport protein ExbD n=1 Tax=Helicobacter mustelae (strain ATCC 43772 / CCUG 25715 / CIP 103759 / LMG 18044 / NCTC 12198 / R85-136P) TaxID=679897 RepID=D3UGD3_HELM1|nr:TonB system transport protein ExbD [Helicobacter mustelae]CBG39554.1 putative exbD/tolR family transport protein [Helicobacter mustelae 12198]SQH71066.1 ExbD/TolR family transport protein [Helicobacter mustelae]STP12195.1 ExbD/TolR family transport protein [Helicobacter mustelae]